VERELGFLIPNDDATKGREYNFEFLGRSWIAEIRRSNTGFWDDFQANGTVHTHSIALRKVRYLIENDELLQAKQIVFFKWVIAWASFNLKTGEQ
jgi:hypothetical protein